MDRLLACISYTFAAIAGACFAGGIAILSGGRN